MQYSHVRSFSILDRRSLMGLSLGMITWLAGSERAQAQTKAGQVDNLLGAATAEALTARRQLLSGVSVFVGDVVATGDASRLDLTLGAATHLKLGSQARLKIDRFLMAAGGTMTLSSGSMLLERPPGSEAQQLNIRGAFGLIAVRGTEVFAGMSRGVPSVFVSRGKVVVTSGGKSVVVNAQEGTDVPVFGGPPTTPVQWGLARVNDALNSVR